MDFLTDSLNMPLHYLTAISNVQRMTSANIANAHTPGYTERSVSFSEILKTNNPFETALSQKMGSKLSEMNTDTGNPVDLQKQLVEMQKNMLFYSMVSRRASSIFNALKGATQVGR